MSLLLPFKENPQNDMKGRVGLSTQWGGEVADTRGEHWSHGFCLNDSLYCIFLIAITF